MKIPWLPWSSLGFPPILGFPLISQVALAPCFPRLPSASPEPGSRQGIPHHTCITELLSNSPLPQYAPSFPYSNLYSPSISPPYPLSYSLLSTGSQTPIPPLFSPPCLPLYSLSAPLLCSPLPPLCSLISVIISLVTSVMQVHTRVSTEVSTELHTAMSTRVSAEVSTEVRRHGGE